MRAAASIMTNSWPPNTRFRYQKRFASIHCGATVAPEVSFSAFQKRNCSARAYSLAVTDSGRWGRDWAAAAGGAAAKAGTAKRATGTRDANFLGEPKMDGRFTGSSRVWSGLGVV